MSPTGIRALPLLLSFGLPKATIHQIWRSKTNPSTLSNTKVEQDDQQGASRTTDAFDLRHLERDPDPMQYTAELRLRNQIFCKARDLYLAPATAQLIDGLTELQAHFAVMVGGELGVYRADLLIFEHNGIAVGQPESTRVEALRKLLERLTDHWDNWQLNLALAGQ